MAFSGPTKRRKRKRKKERGSERVETDRAPSKTAHERILFRTARTRVAEFLGNLVAKCGSDQKQQQQHQYYKHTRMRIEAQAKRRILLTEIFHVPPVEPVAFALPYRVVLPARNHFLPSFTVLASGAE